MTTNTVPFKTVENWWNGKVIIDEIKTYDDTRGMVSEVWRCDDGFGINSKQCYISETEAYVQRGAHEHLSQCDFFISWKNTMVYQMYNPETKEMKIFITDKTKITRVFVDLGIIHSYRNLSEQKAFTMNFPTSLFKGEGKMEEIDEIRHEERFKDTDVYIILDANSDKGSKIMKEYFQNMGEHKYDVIPILEDEYRCCQGIIHNFDFFKHRIENAIGKNRKVYILNACNLFVAMDITKDWKIVE